MTYEQVKKAIEAEASLRPAQRRQPVPCAYCARGYYGSRSCSIGANERKYSKFKSCFAGSLLSAAPGTAPATPTAPAGTADTAAKDEAAARVRREAAMEARLKDIVSDQLGVNQEQVTREASFADDLAADSLDQVEMAIDVEMEFGIQVPDESLPALGTFGQLLDYVKEHATQWRPADAAGGKGAADGQ